MPIILHDTLGLVDERPPRKTRFRQRPKHVSRHDVLWKDLEPAVSKPANPWQRPVPRARGQRRRTHGRSARRRFR